MADGASAPKPTLVKTDDGYLVATWTTSATGGLATGAAVSMSRIKPDSMSVQLVGSFGSATFLLEGSNDNTVWKTCYLEREITAAGKQDVATFTANDAGKVMDDAYRFYRITSSGGTSTSVVVTLVAQRV
jgi:hypothetical protein